MSSGLQITVNGQCPVKNRFCSVKSLDSQTICPVVCAGKEFRVSSFKHLKCNIIGVQEKGGKRADTELFHCVMCDTDAWVIFYFI